MSGAVKNLLPTNALRGFVASNAMIMHTKQKKRELKVQSVNENLASKNEPEIIRIQEKEFLSPTETAQLLGMSRATLYRYLLNGFIPAVQFKGKTKIRRSSLEKMTLLNSTKNIQSHLVLLLLIFILPLKLQVNME